MRTIRQHTLKVYFKLHYRIFLKAIPLLPFIIVAVLGRSIQRVCGAHLRVIAHPGTKALFREMSERWRDIGNTVFDLTGLRYELQNSRSRDERVTARPIGRYSSLNFNQFWKSENEILLALLLLHLLETKSAFFSFIYKIFSNCPKIVHEYNACSIFFMRMQLFNIVDCRSIVTLATFRINSKN